MKIKNIFTLMPTKSCTTNKKCGVALGKIDGREAFAIISQIKLIDTRRLVNKIGFVGREIFENVRKAVRSLI